MKALRFTRSPSRFAAARVGSTLRRGSGARVGPLRLVDVEPHPLPGPEWTAVRPRLAGICGSDLSTVEGRSSRYFEPIVSFPFVPGHEVVGELDDGSRVVVEPILGCVSRGIDPPCGACAAGEIDACANVSFGDLEPGLQSGYCADTGGGWATRMLAHRSQLHPVPDELDDEAAVMVEPAACAVHGVLAAGVDVGEQAIVLGGGTLGLAATAALRHLTPAELVLVAAKYAGQRRFASDLGADVTVGPDELLRAVRRATRSKVVGAGRSARLAGGADVVLDCVGSETSIAQALSVVRPRGTVVLIGMPGTTTVDLAGLWHRGIRLVGSYAYGVEHHVPGHTPERPRTFEVAFDLVSRAGLGDLVSALYPLERYVEALEHAAEAGPRGAVKVAFDLRHERERVRL